MIKKIKHKILFIITCLCITQALGFGTVSSEAGTKTGRIEIDYRGRDSLNQELRLSGARFTLYPVQKKVSGVLCWQGGFDAAGVSLADTSAGARKQQAQDLFAYAQSVNASGVTQVTDATGCTVFADLDEGIYLLAQIGYVEIGTNRFQSPPFLVDIPSDIDGTTAYEVIVEPKAEWVTPPLPPGPPMTPPTQPSVPEPTPTEPTSPTDPQPTSTEKPGPSGGGGSHTGPGPAETTRASEEETTPALTETEVEVEEEETTAPKIIGVKTGDRAHPRLYLALMAISLIGMLVLGDVLRRMKRDEHEG